MKTIGMIGGMSYESTTSYYQIINETINSKLGGLHSAKIIMYSVDFDEIERYQRNNDWDKVASIILEVALKLENVGADFIIICTNTIHKIVPIIKDKINIPILHIAQATVNKLKENKITKVALLGTKYTMQENFYKDVIINSNIDVVVPNNDDIEIINDIIFNELCLGITTLESKDIFINIINKLKNQGVQGVILGCTEIGHLIKQEDLDIIVFDTTYIHGYTAAMMAIEDK